MRVSRTQAAENRETVINVASRLFRERGFDGIGLKDLMKGAGLTQGAFYKQFESKEDLAAQASKRAMESATHRWSDATAANPENPLEAVISFYLSMLCSRRVACAARAGLLTYPATDPTMPVYRFNWCTTHSQPAA